MRLLLDIYLVIKKKCHKLSIAKDARTSSMMRKICLYLRLFFDIKTIKENHLPVENQKPEYLALVLTIEAHFPENHS